jgi:23S rRNA (cytidine1920-2'-O)/16S rRNA (cytidine1409-2'-O)-methyltransferase
LVEKKTRVDLLVAKQFHHLSRNQIQNLIVQGKVMVEGQKIVKPGMKIRATESLIILLKESKFVSKAGFKLELAILHFKINVQNLVVLDAGISTGGFTDCLLQNGARRVYGVDVGHDQVHEKISLDNRVILLEKTNLRNLKNLPEKVDLVTLDLSFISILKVMPSIIKLIKSTGKILVLIKPQFEADRKDIRRGGIVKEKFVHEKVIHKIKHEMNEFNFIMKGVIESITMEAVTKNKEFLALFIHNINNTH